MIPTADGLRLSALLYPPERSPGPGLVIVHSSDPAGQRHGYYVALARHMQREGFTVLTFNLRGYPGSTAPTAAAAFSMNTLVADIRAAVAALLETGLVLEDRISLFGHSFGGGLVIPVMLAESRIWKGVIHAPPAWNDRRITLPDAPDRAFFHERFWRYMTVDKPIPMDAFLSIARGTDMLLQVDELRPDHRPILLLDGSRDGSDMQAFLTTVIAKIPPPCDYYTVPGANHFCNTADFGSWIVMDREILAALSGYLHTWLEQDTRRANGQVTELNLAASGKQQ